jgi:hypothetical protein
VAATLEQARRLSHAASADEGGRLSEDRGDVAYDG